MKTLLTLALLLCSAPAWATTWFVRADGGTRYSASVTTGRCNGQLATSERLVDPSFIGEPSPLSVLSDSNESVLDNYNFMPSSTSPMRGAGVYLSGLTTDANGVAYSNPPPMGALMYVGSAPTALQFFGVFLSGGVRQ